MYSNFKFSQAKDLEAIELDEEVCVSYFFHIIC